MAAIATSPALRSPAPPGRGHHHGAPATDAGDSGATGHIARAKAPLIGLSHALEELALIRAAGAKAHGAAHASASASPLLAKAGIGVSAAVGAAEIYAAYRSEGEVGRTTATTAMHVAGEVAGGWAGAKAGAVAGAAAGAAFAGIGAVPGALIGAAVGAIAGHMAGGVVIGRLHAQVMPHD